MSLGLLQWTQSFHGRGIYFLGNPRVFSEKGRGEREGDGKKCVLGRQGELSDWDTLGDSLWLS